MGRRLASRGATDAAADRATAGAALALADDLARLMDDMTTRQVPWDRLDELVPDKLDAYWQLTLRLPEDRARGVAEDSRPNAARSSRPSGAIA